MLFDPFLICHESQGQGCVRFEKELQEVSKAKDFSDADYLVNPSRIKKSIETEEEYNTVIDDTLGESSSKDLLKQLY